MSTHTKYGFCKLCETWVPRDEMLSVNISVYDAENNEEKIRVRVCPPCQKVFKFDLKGLEWDNNLKTEGEIRTSKGLAEKSELDFDDSEGAMRQAGILS